MTRRPGYWLTRALDRSRVRPSGTQPAIADDFPVFSHLLRQADADGRGAEGIWRQKPMRIAAASLDCVIGLVRIRAKRRAPLLIAEAAIERAINGNRPIGRFRGTADCPRDQQGAQIGLFRARASSLIGRPATPQHKKAKSRDRTDARCCHEPSARLRFELIGPTRAAFPSPEPRHPDQKNLQAEATTCRDPGTVDCPGFLFVAVKTLFCPLADC